MVVLETAVAVAALSGIIQGLVKSLTTHFSDDFFKGRGKDETLPGKLMSALSEIDAVLIDAEEKQITVDAIKAWVNDVKDAVYVAEDALDDILTDASRRNKTIQWLLDTLPSLSKPKLKKSVDTLLTLIERKKGLQLKVETKLTPIKRSNTTSQRGYKEVLGRETEKEEIMNLLKADSEDNKKIPVLAIVGIGGIGKTTLAQLLYNKWPEDEYMKAWIHVSQDDDAESLTKKIYKSVTISTRHAKSLKLYESVTSPTNSIRRPFATFDQLQNNLKEWLEINKTLLVLDDMWCETFMEWDQLWKPFAYADKGSRIIVTTRSYHVAKYVHATGKHTHTLQPLPSEEWWRLFKAQADGAQERELQIFEEFKKEAVHKCKGLPLAAEEFGGLLWNVRENENRSRILKKKIWDPPIRPDICSILDVLRVSYQYLPAHLKRCFAYCSIFPKGYSFDKKRVVLLWMAEGLLQTEASKEEMERVGDGYFSELVSRSLFQRDSTGTAKFTMHDLINELAQFAAGEFCFKYENEIQGITAKTRHLSYLRDQNSGEADKFEELSGANRLRTFLPLSMKDSSQICSLNQMVSHKLLPKLTCLRVLSLSNYNIVPMWPSDIFKRMRHVRYLDLSGTNLERLPTSVRSLYNLQTLLLSYCPNLIQLDDAICNLVKLEHIDLTATTSLKQMPEKFGQLKSLHTLTTFVVGDGKAAKISALYNLTKLRGKLTILELHKVEKISDAEEAHLEKIYLTEINFTWRTSDHIEGTPDEDKIFEKLRPGSQVKVLTVNKYYGNSFPAWMSDPLFSRIVYLRLTECQKCTSLPSLGGLSGLKELRIEKMSELRSIGPEFYSSHPETLDQCQQPFKSLQILMFDDMPNWDECVDVVVNGGTLFPSLQELFVVSCPNLTSALPGRFPSLISLQSQSLVFQLDTDKYPKLERLN